MFSKNLIKPVDIFTQIEKHLSINSLDSSKVPNIGTMRRSNRNESAHSQMNFIHVIY